MIVTDNELDKDFVYFLFAYYFHMTPKEVDEMENYEVDVMMAMLPLWKQKVQDDLEGK